MPTNQPGRRWPFFALRRATFGAAACQGAGIAGALWLLPADGRVGQTLLAGIVLTLTAVVSFLWLSRARAARRWNAALDAYAEREIGREQRRSARKMIRAIP